MSRPLNEDEKDELRGLQCEGAQLLLSGMVGLGERHAGFQLEIGGVVECLVARRVTQLEFKEWAAARMADARSAAARRGPAP